MKRRIGYSILFTMFLIFLTACGSQKPQSAQNASGVESRTEQTDAAEFDAQGNVDAEETNTESDFQYVSDKGTLVIGITEFEPMDYQDEDGNWIGFDADLASAFADSMGVEPVFQLIDWDNKIMELNGKTIDVVWNGMTLTDEVLSAMECSVPYFNNAQVVVVSSELAGEIDSVETLPSLNFAVEAGSAGENMAKENDFSYTEVMDQATALLEVSSGTSDAAIVDFLMAKSMTGEGTSYDNLSITVSLNSEEYGVGFRKGSDLAEVLNQFFQESYEIGQMQEIAERYNIADALVAQ